MADDTAEQFSLFGVELSACNQCGKVMVGTDEVCLTCRPDATEAGGRMTDRQIPCPHPSHGTHEPYTGYRRCASFRTKVKIIARRHGVEYRNVLSTDKITENVFDAELGLAGGRDG
jgi:hypothetical protein